MSQPTPHAKTTGERIFAGLMFVLSVLFIARGTLTYRTGIFSGTSRHGGPYEIVRRPAEFIGASHALLGAFLLFTLASWLWRSRLFAGLAATSCLTSIACMIAAYAGR